MQMSWPPLTMHACRKHNEYASSEGEGDAAAYQTR